MSGPLTADEQLRYERDGFLFPFRVLTGGEVAGYRSHYERLAPLLGGPAPAPQAGGAHLHFPWAYELVTEPAILDHVEDLIGPDILVHSATLFHKPARDSAFVSWHQDAHNWRLDEPRLVSAWVALSPSTAENGCMRAIPQSHRERLDHEARPHRDNMLAVTGLTVADGVDESLAVDFVLAPGEMSLHHADVVHGSNPNPSDIPRCGFAIRYASPEVSQEQQHHPVVLARGRDDYGNYELAEPPTNDDFDAAFAAHTAFWKELHRLPA